MPLVHLRDFPAWSRKRCHCTKLLSRSHTKESKLSSKRQLREKRIIEGKPKESDDKWLGQYVDPAIAKFIMANKIKASERQ